MAKNIFLEENIFVLNRESYLPISSAALLEELYQYKETYEVQVLNKIVHEYAQSTFGLDRVNAIIKAAYKNIPKISKLYKGNQIAIFKDVISRELTQKLLSLKSLKENECNSVCFDNDIDLKKELCELARSVTRAYYDATECYFPYQMSTLEGCYSEHYEENNEHPFSYDSKDNHKRQLSLAFILSAKNSYFNFKQIEGNIKVDIRTSDIVLFPSNYSCIYNLIAESEDVSVFKMYRHESSQ